MGLVADRDLPLLHDLEQCRLCLGRRTIDLIGQDDVGEHRATVQLEAGVLLIHQAAGDIGWQEVGGELDSAHRTVDGRRDRLGKHGLASAGNVFQE